MNHYVVTQTKVFRFEGRDWEDALVSTKNPRKISEMTVEMVEKETGRKEILNG